MSASLVGVVGRVVLAIPPGGPGEVALPARGTREVFVAWCDEPVARGAEVVVVDHPGARSVTVTPMP